MQKLFGDNPLSIIKDPFSLSCVSEIHIGYYNFSNKVTFVGTVKFINGNTKGEQVFKGKDLVDVFMQVKNFCDLLEVKEE